MSDSMKNTTGLFIVIIFVLFRLGLFRMYILSQESQLKKTSMAPISVELYEPIAA